MKIAQLLAGIVISIAAPLQGMQVITCESQERKIDRSVLSQSKTIKYLLQEADCKDGAELTLSAQQLDTILPYLIVIGDRTKSSDNILSLLKQKLTQKNNQKVADILALADYLDIKPLWNISISLLVSRITDHEYTKKFMETGQLDFACPAHIKKHLCNEIKQKNPSVLNQIAEYTQIMTKGDGFAHPYRWVYGHKKDVERVIINEAQTMVASSSRDNTIRLWNAHSGSCLHVLKPLAPVTHLAFNKDGSLLITSSGTGIITIWNTKTGKQETTWRVNYTPDILALLMNNKVICGQSQQIEIRDAFKGTLHAEFVYPERASLQMCINIDESKLIVAKARSVQGIDLSSLRVLWRNDKASDLSIGRISFSNDEKYIKTDSTSFYNGSVTLLNQADGSLAYSFQLESDFQKAEVSSLFEIKNKYIAAHTQWGWNSDDARFYIEYGRDREILRYLESDCISLEQMLILHHSFKEMRGGNWNWINLKKNSAIIAHISALHPALKEAVLPSVSGWAGRIYRLLRPSNRMLVRGAALAATIYGGYKVGQAVANKDTDRVPLSIISAGFSGFIGYKLYEFLGLNKTEW